MIIGFIFSEYLNLNNLFFSLYNYLVDSNNSTLFIGVLTSSLTVSIIFSNNIRDDYYKRDSISKTIDNVILNYSEKNYELCKIIDEIDFYKIGILPSEKMLFSLKNKVIKEINDYNCKLLFDEYEYFFDLDAISSTLLKKAYSKNPYKIINDIIFNINSYEKKLLDKLNIDIVKAYKKNIFIYENIFPIEINTFLKKVSNKKIEKCNKKSEFEYIINFFYKELSYSLLGIEKVSYYIYNTKEEIDVLEIFARDSYSKIYNAADNSLLFIENNYPYTINAMQNYLN